ncbi:MAG TPA: rhodanese-like domain-containing protein, partial [Candidatus Acidoferrales bacterium]|nr:rhodanese-like domain-containing protein [Candidatus Acidoferrales bacterium]
MAQSGLRFERLGGARQFRAAGVKSGDTVVTYCHTGMQASLLYFAARYLGYDAHIFDGSFEAWSNRKDLPVEGP